MPDEKDLEIARLRGQIEGMQQASGKPAKAKRDGDKPNRVGIIILIVVLALVGFIIYANATAETDEQRARRIAASINATCDPKWTGSEEAAGECRLREFQRRADEIIR